MSQCTPFTADGPSGVADALGKVDCLASDATAVSFGRLFGAHGSFQTALTIILTLYVALLAFNLLTGRSALRLSVLTPKMMTLGLVLTFATSWIAYQSVVWNLATGAPDEIASVLVGTNGSATTIFAERLDGVFTAISNAATVSTPLPPPPQTTVPDAPNLIAAAPAAGMASPANILSIAGLILLLGTVGVLVVCRLALAALLIIGPVFIVLALFEGTRGLFEGWLKSVAMFALVPLLTVIMGSGALVAITPMVAGLGNGPAPVELKTAVSVLVASIIYVALMLVVAKVAASLTRGWRMSRAQAAQGQVGGSFTGHQERPLNAAAAAAAAAIGSDRVRSAVTSLETMSSTHRVLTSSPALAAVGTSAQRLALAGPADARNQLRYLHHRVAGVASTQSREMLR
jgi:type IV secretion system protein VirB6